jgi:transposase
VSTKDLSGHVRTMQGSIEAGRRKRRKHSVEFKARAVAACRQTGASLAATAMAHGINANLLRRWLIAQEADERAPAIHQNVALAAGEFVPLQLRAPSAAAPDIRIQIKRGTSTVSINWPIQEAAGCAAWLREWLK